MPTHSNTNEEGKNEMLVQSKEEPYSSIIPGDSLDSSEGKLDPAPLSDRPHQFKPFQGHDNL